MSDPKITQLVRTRGTERVYEMEDSSVISRTGGSVSWRNNNPGNLKFEFVGSADSTVKTTRTRDKALSDAQGRYDGIVDLDQWGNAIFETYEAGREAKIQLLQRQHGERTVPEMLRKYSKADYSGSTHWDAQENSIYKTADAQGVDLRGKKVGEMSNAELAALADGVKNFEGWRQGTVEEVKPTQTQSNQEPYKGSPEKYIPNQSSLSEATQNMLACSEVAIRDLYARSGLTYETQNGEQCTIASAHLAMKQDLPDIHYANQHQGQLHLASTPDRNGISTYASMQTNDAFALDPKLALNEMENMNQTRTQAAALEPHQQQPTQNHRTMG